MASVWLAQSRCQTRLVLRLRKKRSITAFSQRLPLLLMLPNETSSAPALKPEDRRAACSVAETAGA